MILTKLGLIYVQKSTTFVNTCDFSINLIPALLHRVNTEQYRSTKRLHRTMLVYTESIQSTFRTTQSLHRVIQIYTESTQNIFGTTQSLHRVVPIYTESTQTTFRPTQSDTDLHRVNKSDSGLHRIYTEPTYHFICVPGHAEKSYLT